MTEQEDTAAIRIVAAQVAAEALVEAVGMPF